MIPRNETASKGYLEVQAAGYQPIEELSFRIGVALEQKQTVSRTLPRLSAEDFCMARRGHLVIEKGIDAIMQFEFEVIVWGPKAPEVRDAFRALSNEHCWTDGGLFDCVGNKQINYRINTGNCLYIPSKRLPKKIWLASADPVNAVPGSGSSSRLSDQARGTTGNLAE